LREGKHIDVTFICSETESLVWQSYLLNFFLILEPAQKLIKARGEDGPRVCGKPITSLLMGGKDLNDLIILTNSKDIVFRSVPNALANWNQSSKKLFVALFAREVRAFVRPSADIA
jgi:hypothetical protein